MKYNKLLMMVSQLDIEVHKKKRVGDHMIETDEIIKKPMPMSYFIQKVGLSRETEYKLKGGKVEGRNKRGLSLDVIDKICSYLKCQPSDIMELDSEGI